MAEVKTSAGTFQVNDTAYGENGTNDGLFMAIAFAPGPTVNASKFGFVQMVRSVQNGVEGAINQNPVLRAHSIPEGEPGTGFHIDQDPAHRNPIYPIVSQPAGADGLGAGSVDQALGTLGHHRPGAGAGTSATLEDFPRLVKAGPNSSQLFETTVLAIEGPQAGTYYGSVSWGWEKDATGHVRVLPLTLVGHGAPSAIFVRAAELWNQSKDDAGDATLPLPVPKGGPAAPFAQATAVAVSKPKAAAHASPAPAPAAGKHAAATHGKDKPR